jgi:hypothetical protein
MAKKDRQELATYKDSQISTIEPMEYDIETDDNSYYNLGSDLYIDDEEDEEDAEY